MAILSKYGIMATYTILSYGHQYGQYGCLRNKQQKCGNSGGKRNRFKHAIKSYSENRFVSKTPLYFWQNPFIKQIAWPRAIRADQIQKKIWWFLRYIDSPGKIAKLNFKLLIIPNTLLITSKVTDIMINKPEVRHCTQGRHKAKKDGIMN